MKQLDSQTLSEFRRYFGSKPQIYGKLPSTGSFEEFTEVWITNQDGQSYDSYKLVKNKWIKTASSITSNEKIVTGTTGGSATSAVDSFNGRTGVVTPQTGDYSAAQVGLGNVDNVQQLPMSYLDTDGALSANSDTKVASQKAGKTYSDTKLAKSSNLSDVANQQTALDNITNVSAATNEYVLTKDTVTGNALWKVPTGSGSSNDYEFFPFYPVSAAGIGNRPGNYAISDYSVAWSAVTPNGSQTVQKDFGSAYFDADFEIQFEFGAGVGCTNSSIIYFLMLTNTVNTYTAITGASGDLLCLFFNQTAGGVQNIGVRESNNASITTATQAISKDVVYYCTLIRDESVGTYGRLTLNMYSDAARTSLAFTLYIDLTEKQDFRYLIVGSGAGAAPTSANSFGVIAHLEIISA